MKPQLTIVFALFCLSLTAQVKFKVKLLSDNVTYQVLLMPEQTWNSPMNAVPSAQVTVRVPTGGFNVGTVTGLAGTWSHSGTVVAPQENPGFDYINFGLQGATSAISFQTGVEVPVFNFTNSGNCTGELELLDHDTDPFMPPNSQSVNVGNSITVIGAGFGNAYTGNYGAIPADCTPSSNCGIEVFDVILSSPSACGVADGSIEIEATNTNGLPLQYSINFGSNQTTWQSSPVFSNLASGNLFKVAVRDIAAICLVEVGEFELDGPLAAVILGVNTTDPDCGQANGSISINAVPENGGVLEYAMSQSGPWQSSNTFNGLAEGTYSFWVRDIVNNCSNFVGTYNLDGCVDPGCLITYDLVHLGNGKYQVNLTSDTTWTFPNNITSSLQVTLKVPTGGFVLSSLESQVVGVNFSLGSTYAAPNEDPAFDYVSIMLASPGTQGIPYVQGNVVPLFTFENTGTCNGDSLLLMANDDPFFPPNSQSANVGQQLSVSGFGGPDIPVCLGSNAPCESVPPPPPSCLVVYEIEKLAGDVFQVSMIPDTTWTPPNNITSSMQFTVKVPTGGFVVSDLTSQVPGVNFDLASTYVAPAEDPGSDYISFILASPGTSAIPFQNGVKTPLFSFKNSGTCQGEQVVLMDNDTDPFFPPNSLNAGVGQQLTVLGFGGPDAPVCISNLPAEDCTNDPCATLAPGFQAPDACEGAVMNFINTTTSTETIISWSWDFGDNSALSTVESPSHTFASSGNFEVSLTVTTESGCVATFSEFVTVFPSPGQAPVDYYVVCNGVGDTLQSPANVSTAVWSPATGLDDPNSLTPYAQPNVTTEYTLTVTNDFGCQATSLVTVEVANKPIFKDVVVSDQSDCGVQDGSILISAVGDGQIEYSLDNINWTTDSLFSGLAPGDYTVFIRNSNGTCTQAFNGNPMTITAPAPPTFVDAVATQPNGCADDGSITITANGGNGPLQYSIDGGQTFQASNVFNNLGGGTYTIAVANNDGSCEQSGGSIILNEPAPPAIVTPIADQSLCEGANATVSIQISNSIASYSIGGNGAFSNDNSNGNTLSFDIAANAVGTTNYVIDFTDNNGCIVTETFNLTGLAVPTASFTVSPTLCTGGEVTLDFTGTAGPGASLNWSLDGGQLIASSNSGATIVASWATSGQKTITLNVNDQGCQDMANTTINISDFNPNASLNVTDADCGANSGAINLSLSGTGYSFEWSNGSSNQNLTNLSGGTYQVTITEDGSGCSATASAVVGTSQPVSVASLTEEAATDCSGGSSDGSLTVEISGGTANFIVNLLTAGNGGGSVIDQFTGNQATYTFTGLHAGAYQVEVVDANGCSDIATTAITAENSDLAVSATVQDASCGANDGSFSVNISGGQMPYTYDFYQNNQAQATDVAISTLPLTIANQAPGASVMIVRDANGCITPLTIEVGTQPAGFSLSASMTPAGCSANDGAVMLSGLPMNPTIEWESSNGTSLGSANPLENLAAGVYFVTVTDAGGCSKSSSYVVSSAGGPTATVVSTENAGCGSSDGSVTFMIDGGGNFFSYRILGTPIEDFANLNEEITEANLAAGAYVLKIENQSTGCEAFIEFEIEGGSQIFTSSTVTTASACGVADGFVEIEITGGTAPFTVTTDQGTAPVGTVMSMATITDIYEGIVNVTIADASGCSIIKSYNFGDFIEPDLSEDDLMVENYTCPGEFGSIAAADAGKQYQIFDENNTFVAITPWTGATAGFYDIHYTENGCTAVLENVEITGPADWEVEITTEEESCTGNDGALSIIVAGANGSYAYAWSNGDQDNTAEGLAEGTYSVTVTDFLGCSLVESDLFVANDCNDTPCPEVFLLDTFNVELSAGFTEICLPTELTDLSSFDLVLDGATYPRELESCVDSTIFYGYGMLLGLGSPPYRLDEWSYRGQVSEGFMFDDIAELVVHMNGVDPTGNWILDEDESSISGGSSNADYGSLIITHVGSATTLSLQVNTVSVAHPSILVNSEPVHVFIVSDPASGCKDTLFINVLGSAAPQIDTMYIEVPVGGIETVCLPLDELPGVPEQMENYCISVTNNAQLIELGDECLEIIGNDLGEDKACFVICDDLGYCDTTLLLITVYDTSRQLVIHNGFSPNEDGVNDYFRIKNIELYPNNSLSIFNRWGKSVYTAQRYSNSNPWKAIYRNTHLPDGTYFYLLEVEIDGKMETRTGYVQVNR